MSFKATTRIELYEQVWKTTMVHLAKSYKCSPAELREICIAHDVPLPRNGYWTQVETGKQVPQPKLPFRDRYQDAIEIKETLTKQNNSSGEGKSYSRKQKIKADDDLKEGVARLAVATELSDPHPLVKKTLQVFEGYKVKIAKLKKSRGGWSALSRDDWPPHEDKGRYSFYPSDGALPITASLMMVVPILLILDPLLKALSTEKFKTHIETDETNKYRSRLIVEKDGEQLTFWVTEGYSWHSRELKKKDYESSLYSSKVAAANGNLSFHIEGLMGGRKKTFTNGKRKSLEDQIDDIFNTFLTFPIDQRQRRELREREQAEFERRLEIDRHNRSILTSQREQFDVALKEASAYRDYAVLEEYVRKVENAANDLAGREQELSNLWIKIVRHYLVELDPIEKRIKRFQKLASTPDSFYSESWFKDWIEKDDVDEDDEENDDGYLDD